MLVTRRSPFTGKLHVRDIPADPWAIYAYMEGLDPRPIQVQLPGLSPDDREFLMTGVAPEEWAALEEEQQADVPF